MIDFEIIGVADSNAEAAPIDLHLPQFVYSEPKASNAPVAPTLDQSDDAHSQGFPFSALFQSSSASAGISITPDPNPKQSHSSRSAPTSFIGFSWGPPIDAFSEEVPLADSLRTSLHSYGHSTPRIIVRSPRNFHRTPALTYHNTANLDIPVSTHFLPESGGFSTPLKSYSISPHTLPRTSTIRRTAPRRGVSDREAMKQLVDCVGMSARKKVLESGRKPTILGYFSSKSGTKKKDLRFGEFSRPIPIPDFRSSASTKERSRSHSRTTSASHSFSRLILGDTQPSSHHDESDIYERPAPDAEANAYSSAETTDSEGGAPPSPSPRPSSAMSASMTMFSRRSATPTTSAFLVPTRRRAVSTSASRLSATFHHPSSGDGSVSATTASTAATTMATSSGLLSVPPTSSSGNFVIVPKEALSRPDHQLATPEILDTSIHEDSDQREDWMVKMSSDDQFGELEERHGKIMRDIRHLENKLDQFLSYGEV